MSERERAERIVNDIHSRVDRDGELDDYWRNLCVMDVLALMREERARAYEEAAYYLEYRSSGPIPPDAIDHMKDCAKRLREEGGHDVDQGPSR